MARREAQSWEEQVIAQSITRDGNVDRQCGFVCQVEPPIQPHVNSWCRELSARYGMRAQRVGEASHPGPRSQNRVDADHAGPIRRVRVPDNPSVNHVVVGRRTRRRRRLRPLPWSWSDSESDAEPCPNVVPRTDDDLPNTIPASQTALHEVGRLVCQEQVPMHDLDALEEDLDRGRAPFSRRVVLHPESSGGTPRSVQDRSPEMSMCGNRFAALAGTEIVTMPASTGSLRRVGGGEPSTVDDTLLASTRPTQWESEARGHAAESDLLDAMEFDLTIRDPTRTTRRTSKTEIGVGWRCGGGWRF